MHSGSFANPYDRTALMAWIKNNQPGDDWQAAEDSKLGEHGFRVDEDSKVLYLGSVAYALYDLWTKRWSHERN